MERKTEDKPERKASDTGRTSLEDSFRDAVFGDFCRTRSFETEPADTPVTDNTPLNKVWWEAYNVSQQGWNIVKKEWQSRKVKNTDRPLITQTPVENCQGLSFFQAIEKLADYEASRRTPANSSSGLGYKHFMAFAEREGIVFDVEGRPYPTVNGHIPGAGVFSEDTHGKAERAYRNKRRNPVIPLPDLLPDIDTPSDFATTRDSIEQIEHVLIHLKKIAMHVNLNLNDMPWVISSARAGKKLDLKEQYQSAYESIKILLHSPKSLYTDQDAVDQAIDIPIKIFQYCLYLGIAAETKYHLTEKCSCSKGNCTSGRMETFQKAAQKILEDMGYQEGVEEAVYRTFKTLRHHFEQGGKKKAYEGLGNVVDYLEKTHDFLEYQLGIGNTEDIKERPPYKILLASLKPPSPL